jgi:hypothetical protein
MLDGLRSFLGFGGGVQYAPGMATTWAASTMGQKLSALGRSNAALMGGALLAFDGLRRGGWLGVGETTAGGALVGFKYGGLPGAAIGAGVGFVAGLVRLFVKSAEEKVREKVKALYGVDISDKGVLKQIADTVKSAYGGNIDLAIRSPHIRDLIQLYAMSTGQSTRGMPATVHPLDIYRPDGRVSVPIAGVLQRRFTPRLGRTSHARQDPRWCGLRRWARHYGGQSPDRLEDGRERDHPERPRGGPRRDQRHEGERRTAGTDESPSQPRVADKLIRPPGVASPASQSSCPPHP